jgi:hypothetical protein
MQEKDFMTQENQDVMLGRVVRQHKTAVARVASLEDELAKAQRMYQRLGSALGRVQLIRFDDDPESPAPYAGFVQGDLRFRSEEIDGKRLKLLCNDLREARADEAALAEQKKQLES